MQADEVCYERRDAFLEIVRHDAFMGCTFEWFVGVLYSSQSYVN
jgi:hypothetical protein